MNRQTELFRETYDALHASAQTRQEVLNMNRESKRNAFFGKRVLVAALAVVLTLALAVGAMAAAGVFKRTGTDTTSSWTAASAEPLLRTSGEGAVS